MQHPLPPCLRLASSSDSHDVLIYRRLRYRSQGLERTLANATSSGGWTAQLCINCGWSGGEFSDWALAVLIVFNRELTTSEIQNVEGYLSSTYGLPLIQRSIGE